jgi:hypothetical protein
MRPSAAPEVVPDAAQQQPKSVPERPPLTRAEREAIRRRRRLIVALGGGLILLITAAVLIALNSTPID